MISELEMKIATKLEGWLYPGMSSLPCKDIQITLTKEFCENHRNNRRHYLFMTVLAIIAAYSTLVIGTSIVYYLHLDAKEYKSFGFLTAPSLFPRKST